MFYRDAVRAFDALIGEVEAAGEAQRKTGWMKQAWHRRLTWLRWLRELKSYTEDRETMALAYHIERERLETALWQILWSTRDQCEHFTSGIGSCFRNGRTPEAFYGAERCCNSCIAHLALHPIGSAPPVAMEPAQPPRRSAAPEEAIRAEEQP